MTHKRFTGAMTAIVTPMDGSAIDVEALAQLIEDQIAAGIDGIVSVGTTGESATLTMAEHKDVIRTTVELVGGRVPVIAGAGANSTREATELSKASADAGADALLQVTPYYNKPTQDGLYRHFVALAEATPLPIILYNVPGRTACDMLAPTVARLADIDHIVAIKEATGSMKRASDIIASAGDRIAVLSGDDATAYPLLALGGQGVISVVSNVWPARIADMCHAAAAGDLARARAAHYDIMPLSELLFVESNPIPVKAALALMGKIKAGIRPPLYECSPELTARLEAELSRVGLL
ncbi:MAG TPA: 4-hydroxy-tetrahydrodipicolinate synthase [Kofleriaceae bacterium]|nr:4-hydroxy-tetrahydrodipicolinate synthase [Kofleriaceae bacterium]